MGVPQSDGRLPATVIRANAIVTYCVRIAKAAHANNGDFVFELPLSRGADSRFAIEEKSEHVDMASTHKEFAQLAATKELDASFSTSASSARQHLKRRS
eukprot:4952295-Pleurochrysis_carterae.AAC.1